MSAQGAPPARHVLALCGSLLAGWLAAWLPGCNDERPPPPLARFDRPSHVAFVCARSDEVLPLADCKVTPDKTDAIALHALVTQGGRGELAAVNLRTRVVIDSRRDIPGFTFEPVGEAPSAVVVGKLHPSHTYVASFGSRDVRVLRTRALLATVTEEPSAQTIRLSGGERPIAPTAMALTPDERALIVVSTESSELHVLPIVRCAEGQSDCEDGLIDIAAIRTVDLRDSIALAAEPPAADDGAPRYEQLCGYPRATPDASTQPTLDPAELTAAPRPTALAVDDFCAADAAACTARLLVADGALPLIHVLDLAALVADAPAVQAPLVPGTPTRAVVVTPRVPRSLDSDEETQFVYAIDVRDGSVIAMEDGRVLAVNADPTMPADRIALGASRQAAQALEVLTPTFDVTGPAAQYVSGGSESEPSDLVCSDALHPNQTPNRLRGVFLAVALSDGTLRIVDVHDMELINGDGAKDAMGNELPACRRCSPAGMVPVLVRHHARLATSFVPFDEGAPVPSFKPVISRLQFEIDGIPFELRSDGTTASPNAPGLACMQCSGGRVRVFPESVAAEDETDGMDAGTEDGSVSASGDLVTDASVPLEDLVIPVCPASTPDLVCSGTDPWATPEDDWSVLYEGRIPGTEVGVGRFVEPGNPDNRTGGLELLTELDACASGVLGEEDMAPEYAGCSDAPDASDFEAFDGDQLVVLSRPLGAGRFGSDERVAERCASVRAALEEDPTLRVAFEIRRAYVDRLVVRTNLLREVGDATRFEDVAGCFESPINFDVRTFGAFTVRGLRSGFAHSVTTSATGRCVTDPRVARPRRGRARLGCMFENESVQFTLRGPDAGETASEPLPGTNLALLVNDGVGQVAFEAFKTGTATARVVTSDLRYNPIDEKLYLVDSYDRGLLPIGLDPLPPALGTASQFR